MVSLLSVLLLLLLSSHAFSAVIPEDVLSQAKIDFITYSDPNPNSQFFEQPSYIGSWVMQICFCMYSTAQARPKNLLSVWRTMIIGSIDSSLFSGENPGSCKEFVKFLLKGKFQLDHCVELQFIFHFACIFAFGAKWSFSVWKRLAYISSQAWNLQVSFSSTNNNNSNSNNAITITKLTLFINFPVPGKKRQQGKGKGCHQLYCLGIHMRKRHHRRLQKVHPTLEETGW